MTLGRVDREAQCAFYDLSSLYQQNLGPLLSGQDWGLSTAKHCEELLLWKSRQRQKNICKKSLCSEHRKIDQKIGDNAGTSGARKEADKKGAEPHGNGGRRR